MYTLSLTSALSIIAAILGLFYYLVSFPKEERKRKLPPFPVRTWPLVGSTPSLQDNPRKQFRQWHRKHGDLFSLYFGNTLVVVINGYNTIREAFVKKGSALLDRPVMFANEVIGMSSLGVAFSSGPQWQETRSTSMSIMRELSMGKDVLNERIQEEIGFLIQRLANRTAEPTDVWHHVHLSVANVICSILIGRRFTYDDERFREVLQDIGQLGVCAKEMAAINYMPVLRHLPGDMLKTGPLRKAVGGLKEFSEFFCHNVDRQDVEGSTATAERASFVSVYKRRQRQQVVSDGAVPLDDQNLSKTVMDLIGAGTEAVSATIAWCLLYLIHHPDVQTRIQQELDIVIGHGRRPCMSDNLKLPYLAAVIKETQRLASINPFSIMRATSKDVEVNGFTIPRGTSVIPNLDSVLSDPDIWGQDADQFRPDRFLNPDGTVRHREEFIPFSVGRRACLGVGLAQMELFLFLASMLQRFQFVIPEGEQLPSLQETLGLIAVPTQYRVRCVDRFDKGF